MTKPNAPHDSSEPVVEQWMRDAVVNMRQDELRWLRAASVEHDARIIARHYAASQPDSGEPLCVCGKPASGHPRCFDGSPMCLAEPPASPAGDAVATDNLRPNQYEIEPKPPVGDEKALSNALAREIIEVVKYTETWTACIEEVSKMLIVHASHVTAQLRQELAALQDEITERSMQLPIRLAQAREQALRDAADAWENGGMDENSYTGFLRERADTLAARPKTKEPS